jgi:exonuclease III
MSLLVASINVNGLRDTKKRNYSFLWLIKQKYDFVCLQETIILIRQLKMKKKENGRQLGGGENTWNCGSSNTRGVGILLI